MANEDGPFDPRQLSSGASLNQTVIDHPVAGPGVMGRRAGELCTRDALKNLALEGQALSDAHPDRLADQLGEALRSERSRASAEAVLQEYGRRLGALIATLTQGGGTSEVNPYRRGYVAHWHRVEEVWLAGGLLAGGTAATVLFGAEEVLRRAEVRQPVRLLPRAPYAALIGAARMTSAGTKAAIVADLGHTKIKTATAVINDRAITALVNQRSTVAPERPEEAFPRALEAVTAALRLSQPAPAVPEVLTVSVACYVRAGLPIDDGRSVYTKLGRQQGDLEARLSAEAGRSLQVRFVHDGTAAAVAADQGHTSGVITLGSWLAVGFTPTFSGLLDLASELCLGPEHR